MVYKGKWLIGVTLEVVLLPACGAPTCSGWLVMAVQDGPAFPLTGSQDSESPKTTGKQQKAITLFLTFLITPATVQKWVMAARDASNIV